MKKIKKDIIIIGAGVIGSSVAMHLSKLSDRSIGVIDIDLLGGHSSSERNAGGVRSTWNHPLNIELSRKSIEFFETIRNEVGFRQLGYTWMVSKNSWNKVSKEIEQNQKFKSLDVTCINVKELQKKYSFIDRHEGVGGAMVSPKDGLINPNLIKNYYRDQSMKKNTVEYFDRIWLEKMEFKSNHFRCLGFRNQNMTEAQIESRLSGISNKGSDFELVEIEAEVLVNCAGPWASQMANQIDHWLCPSHAVRRQICLFECKDLDLTNFGMFVDTSGVYFHSEAQYILSGYADPREKTGYSFEYDAESFFQEKIWTPLFERSSKFEMIKHITGWAGLYEESIDKMPILGAVNPQFFNNHLFEAHSFSGRGLMQSYEAGRILSSMILNLKEYDPQFEKLSSARFYSSQGDSGFTEMMII